MLYKPLKTPVLDKAWFYQQGREGSPEKRAVERINSMLQRKKGGMYGGHKEDATQISARMLPPVGVRMLEGAAFLSSLRCRLNSCKLLL